ncbi:MAG TPA: hypothetical protein VH253_17935 [Phycisphaerae bacterium]|nr:hypothetical protein [Phycisphaerae bacterium]
MSTLSQAEGEATADPGATGEAVPLVARVTCPHCWFEFPPEQILWVAQHEDLMGDSILKEEPLRFLPTHFNIEGQAIDARGMTCHHLACPNCHLIIPRVLVENEVTFISLIGSAGSGKSNFLAAMTWELRRRLARDFAVIFADGDKEANWLLNRNEETLFLPEDPDTPIVLEKTHTQGDHYRSIPLRGQDTQLPKPFLFTLHPGPGHPRVSQRAKVGRIVCLYDNAGEHFGVGQDTASSPVTRHLTRSKVLMFLMDPTQDPRFRAKLKGISQDPQVVDPLQTVRQETILGEAAIRYRRHLGLSAYKKTDRPLLVLVAKSDIWASLLEAELDAGPDALKEPIIKGATAEGLAAIDLDRVNRVSRALRALLLDLSPEVVTAAEDFSQEVLYMPVSALGHSPEKYADRAGLLIKPKDVHPRWVTIPLLYSYAKWSKGLIAASRTKEKPAP